MKAVSSLVTRKSSTDIFGMKGRSVVHVSELHPLCLPVRRYSIELKKDLADVCVRMEFQNSSLVSRTTCNAQEEACRASVHDPKAVLLKGLQPQDTWHRGQDVSIIKMYRNDDDVRSMS